MTTYCVTFGQRYRQDPHPASPLIHPDGWLEIEADTEDLARALAVKALGSAWSGLYPLAEVGAEYYPRGAVGIIFRCTLCSKVVINDRAICPDCLAAYEAELDLASALAQIPAGWHVEYDEAGETLLYYGTAQAGRIMHHHLGWWGGNRWHQTREQAVEAQIEMWEPIIAANEAAGRPPLELPPSPIGRANWGRR